MTKKIIIGLGSLLIIMGLVFGYQRSRNQVDEQITPEITLESSKMIDSGAKLQAPMSEAEKQAIEKTFLENGAEMTMLRDVNAGQSVGTAWRNFDQKFNFKIEANRLSPLAKGFFYEAWLVGESGFFSIGRLAETDGQGVLFYAHDQDKSDFKGVVVTLEAEDGNAAPDKHILEGNF